jgi:uncharacterized small protein (DUF1192 family)
MGGVSEQKLPGKSWESWIEEQIRQAEEDGAFRDLPGAGKPLPGLAEGYDPLWWVKNLVRREQLSLLPPALELLRKVEAELAHLPKLRHQTDVRARIAALNAEITRTNATATQGPLTRLAPLDVEAIVQDWRRARASDVSGT